MERIQLAPGVFITEIKGEKFKRCKLLINLIVPSVRSEATVLAVLPHVLNRRCEAIPDATALSRKMFSLYGAELSSDSYTAGANRVLSIGVSGLKNEYALNGEDLAGEYLTLACNLLFAPKLSGGVFEVQDVEIEKEKQAEFLRSEINNKRSYCIRKARRKLYGDSPLGIESCGYAEDIQPITSKSLYESYRAILQNAQLEIYVCGMDAQSVAGRIKKELEGINRTPIALATATPLPKAHSAQLFEEEMDTAQGKLCIMLTSGQEMHPQTEAHMRLASALYGGLPTSRLFTDVREKQSLCYYCAAAPGPYGGTLTVDSGVDHKDADKASKAILHALKQIQEQGVSEGELQNGKSYLKSAYATMQDSADAMVSWVFNEWLRGTNRTVEQMVSYIEQTSAQQVQDVLSAYAPAVEYRIVGKGENA